MTTLRTTPALPINLEHELPWLAGRGRQTTRLHPRPDPHVTAISRMGGQLLWPVNEPWPYCPEHGSACVGVLQLAATDVPQLLFPPNTDLFQLLWCPFDHAASGYGPAASVVWRAVPDARALQVPPIIPPDADEGYLPTLCALHPEPLLEYPDFWDLSNQEREYLVAWYATGWNYLDHWGWTDPVQQPVADRDDLEDIYYEYFSVAPGTKVGGYVKWIHPQPLPLCSCGQSMEHLLTIDTEEFDVLNWPRWCPQEDQALINARVITRPQLQRPSGLMLGDVGSFYVFVCRSCNPWRNTAMMQHS